MLMMMMKNNVVGFKVDENEVAVGGREEDE